MGIKKLLGSLPFLKIKMELINNSTNIKPKRIKITEKEIKA
ncbi:unnamed protein product, partial [marine sediment metagenome]